MERCVNLGLTKSIGVSNFNIRQLNDILVIATIKPVVNQVKISKKSVKTIGNCITTFSIKITNLFEKLLKM